MALFDYTTTNKLEVCESIYNFEMACSVDNTDRLNPLNAYDLWRLSEPQKQRRLCATVVLIITSNKNQIQYDRVIQVK